MGGREVFYLKCLLPPPDAGNASRWLHQSGHQGAALSFTQSRPYLAFSPVIRSFPGLTPLRRWQIRKLAGGDEIGGPGISQVHLQILGDGGRNLFLAEISLGKGSGRYQPKGQSKWETSSWARLPYRLGFSHFS